VRTAVLPALLPCLALAACALPPPELHQQFAVREVPYTPDSGTVAVQCGQLIDGHSNIPHGQMMVVIRDGRITGIEPGSGRGSAVATRIPVLDLLDYTCLPGLIDMHTHLTDRPEDTADLRVYVSRSANETERQAEENAAATLLAGFTSVRNVGTYVLGADTQLRDVIERGAAVGPRMQVSGPYLTIPHGGGDLYVPDFTEPTDNARFHAGVASGPEEFRARAEGILAGGVDLLKVIASGAVLAYGGVPGAPEMSPDEIKAVVEVAHAGGKKVAAHAHGAESIRMAIEAGVDTVEHASYLDDAGIAAALKHGTALAMYIYNGDYIDTEGRRMKWPEEFLRKNIETTEIQRQHFARAVKAGVRMVFATDAGVYPHGLNARQFRFMVANGMTPMQAIQSATSVAAHYMGREADIGTLEVGKLGDLIAVRGNPLFDITMLEEVDVVIKGGILLKLPAPP